jgi:hypothetical protein
VNYFRELALLLIMLSKSSTRMGAELSEERAMSRGGESGII